jgi:DNA polymerase I-like protein with 3'-5' exonuclease and polymerase domains
MTNVVHCVPPKDEVEGTTGEKSIGCCMNQHTIEEVRGYPIVVLVGNAAMKAFFPEMKATHLRGNVAYHPDYPGQRFYSVFHPAYQRQNPQRSEVYFNHLQRLSRVLKEEEPRFKIHTGSPAIVEKLRAQLAANKRICFDFETNKLQTWHPDFRIKSVAVAFNKDEAFFAHEDEVWFLAFMEELAKWLQGPNHQIIGTNLGFDVNAIEATMEMRVTVQFVFELAMLWYYARGYQEPSQKELVATHTDGYRFLVYQPHLEKDVNLLCKYNCEDVIHGIDLFEKGWAMLAPKTRDLYMRVMGPGTVTDSRMQHRGVWVNQAVHKQTRADIESEVEAALQKWAVEDVAFNRHKHTSGKGLEEYLFTLKQLPVLKSTPSGERSTDEEVIKEYIRQGHTYLKNLLTVRGLEKDLSTFVVNIKDHLDYDNRVHPSWQNTSTDTGRKSCRRPNLQNQKRDKRIRGQYGVPPGHILLQGDFSQIELRIAMCLAKDPVGIKAYRDGKDLHWMTGSAMAGGEPTKEQRTWAKPVNFSLIYGGSAEGLQAYAQNQYDIIFTLDQSKEFVRTFFGTYKQLQPWHASELQKMAAQQGHFMNEVGHTFYYKGWNHDDSGHTGRSWINSTCQGTAAAINTYAMVLTEREFIRRKLNAGIIATVHDSILVDCASPAVVEEAMQIMQYSIRQVHQWISSWFVVPLVMDFELGEHWGKLEEVKKAA